MSTGAVSASEWHEFITYFGKLLTITGTLACVAIAESVFCTPTLEALSFDTTYWCSWTCALKAVYCPDLIDQCVEHVAKSELAVTTL